MANDVSMSRRTLQDILQASARQHVHLCPRQVLGARMGLHGMAALGFEDPPPGKRLLVLAETDGCFLDGLSAATECTPGHRTLRIEDYGKTAATFIDIKANQALRLAPATNIRNLAMSQVPEEHRKFQAQLQAYQVMPAEAMFSVTPVTLRTPIAAIVSRPRVRVDCSTCGEEIINEREIRLHGLHLCRICAQGGYYEAKPPFTT
jgi:formylmethanofuran dehydrogenase subunit E